MAFRLKFSARALREIGEAQEWYELQNPGLGEEVRRRERVIRIFPNDESALRLIGALLAEQNEVWQEREYLDTDEFNEWVAAQKEAKRGNNIVAMAG